MYNFLAFQAARSSPCYPCFMSNFPSFNTSFLGPWSNDWYHYNPPLIFFFNAIGGFKVDDLCMQFAKMIQILRGNLDELWPVSLAGVSCMTACQSRVGHHHWPHPPLTSRQHEHSFHHPLNEWGCWEVALHVFGWYGRCKHDCRKQSKK